MLKSEDIEVSQVGYSTGGMRVGMSFEQAVQTPLQKRSRKD